MSRPRLEFSAFSHRAAKWPLPGKVLLGCALGGLVLAMGELMQLGPARVRLQQAQAQEMALQRQLAESAVLASELEERARQLQLKQAQVEGLLRQLPGGPQMPSMLEDIARLALANGLVIESVLPQDEQLRPLYAEQPVQIGLTGAYHDLASFVSALADLSRFTTVHEMRLQADGRLLRLDLQARIYRRALPSSVRDEAEPSPLRKPRFIYRVAGLRDPFQPLSLQVEHVAGRRAPGPDPMRPRGLLEGLALDRFEMVGTLSRGAQTFALLRVASTVHRLAVGDYLGPDYGRVTAIHDNHIELVELFPDKQGAWLERPRTLVLNVNS
ncbi:MULTISPECIES: pilus assembly protein PilP [Pseudomonas]|jgi:Tfp pilus assembly protein PilO/Tfp pilus assembly protein PilP|uniref:Pilus assembly protein PilP n=2 Tax=Pseudomonas TaxID=286 RepID=A0A8I1E6R6_9PSED|nr:MULTISPECIES: pilus assembly protein PilP [Pseudomonas]MBI6600724.1 pilus assembly protein PilP [Pseudomonas sp. S4_EA_1b]MBI6625844.1 pilus assembly protein PilP [Pseudomonas rhodesiae]MBX4137035.1 pilus assembly protein PilP [Pseudomonas sp. S5F11]MDN6863308.1 pilus assembly protein PilP [Pseudomonas rhodesiae]NMY79101.1 type 4a pilus biogenesis protein PilO [Pseudomonas rhodesiae]